ncbi:MAG TPA: radical SAM protein, partial [Clostridiaceae bacterium]|nr:radical SAM protein [Clostridiaceae bacterium]
MKNSTDMVIGNVITGIEKESIAKELGIEPGSRLLYINGQPVEDIIDYKYLISDEHIVVDILKDGEEWEYEIDKDYDEDIG